MNEETVRRLTEGPKDSRVFAWSDITVCTICGAAVAAADRHDTWHAAVATAVTGRTWSPGGGS